MVETESAVENDVYGFKRSPFKKKKKKFRFGVSPAHSLAHYTAGVAKAVERCASVGVRFVQAAVSGG